MQVMLTWKNGALALGVVALLAGGFYLRNERIAERLAAPAPAPHPWAVHWVKVAKGTVTEGFPVLATMASSDEISIRPQVSGVIETIGPREGNRVEKGTLLAVIDTTPLRKELSALQASLASAIAQEKLQDLELKRTQKLAAKGFASLEKRDQLVAALEGAAGKRKQLAAQIAELKTKLGYGRITSPVKGEIVARNQVVGDLASPGKEIYKINVASGAKVKILVPQEILADLHIGSAVILTYAGKRKTVFLTRLIPSLDALSMGTAEADLDKAPFSLPSGARISARVITKAHKNVLILPLSSIALSGDGRHGIVFKVVREGDGKGKEHNNGNGHPGHLVKTKVTILARGLEGLAVTADLAPSDEVVSAHASQLLRYRDRDKVIAVPLEHDAANMAEPKAAKTPALAGKKG